MRSRWKGAGFKVDSGNKTHSSGGVYPRLKHSSSQFTGGDKPRCYLFKTHRTVRI